MGTKKIQIFKMKSMTETEIFLKQSQISLKKFDQGWIWGYKDASPLRESTPDDPQGPPFVLFSYINFW